ncbi:alpha/beta hydrolase [uncultured Granulicatella sp.]|uniref:alpha/beta hydrolase n=1 Tax=uncultured Granulicatella sp. TaxID=316089 RepID=UPI0028D86FF0|nr:alpha/beta hydrolase [uncultured Granulicatella sp.]
MSLTSHIVRTLFTIGDLKRDLGWVPPTNVETVENLSYGSCDKWHLLDLYRPKDKEGKLPVLLNIHGGAWVYGDKKVYAPYCMYLAAQGFAVVNASYRLAPKHTFPAPLEDVGSIMEWVVTNAKQYHLDLRNLFFVGDSAGAHLATAYTAIQLNSDYAKEFPKITVSPKFVPKALVLNCGVFDMEGEVEHRGVLLTTFLTDILGEKPTGSSIKKMSPVRYITPDFPPVYLATSNGDFLRKHSHRLKEVLEQKQIDFVFKEYGNNKKTQGHVFHLNLKNKVGQTCNQEQIKFVRKIMER